MMKISEVKLITAINGVFERIGSKFCLSVKLPRLLLEQGLTSEEAKQAISFAKRRGIIRMCYAHAGEIHGDLCYELLTSEDREFAEELHKKSVKKRWP